MGIYSLILQLKKLRLCELPEAQLGAEPRKALLSEKPWGWGGGEGQEEGPGGLTLYRPPVMRARSNSPPAELPTINGTGLCTS